MLFQDFANSLKSELQLPNKQLPRQKPTAKTSSDAPLPGQSEPKFCERYLCSWKETATNCCKLAKRQSCLFF